MARQIEMTVQGVLGTDPTLSEAPGRRPFCHFRLANTPTYRAGDRWDEGETIWFTVKAWGNLALNLSRSFRKGDPVLLLGRFTQETWQRRDDGAIQVTNVLTVTAGGHDLARGASHYSRIPVRTWDKDGKEIIPGADAAASARPGASPSSQTQQAPGAGPAAGSPGEAASEVAGPAEALQPRGATGSSPAAAEGDEAWLVREDPAPPVRPAGSAGSAEPAGVAEVAGGTAGLAGAHAPDAGCPDSGCTDGEVAALLTDDPLSYEVVTSGEEAAQ